MMGTAYSSDDDWECLEDDNFDEFQDPEGNSALRRETESNPRNCDCPTCGNKNVLTQKDKKLGYQCDDCADRTEGCPYAY